MDSLIAAAARALAGGDPLAALDRVALREDAPALALRGIAMAQLGEHLRARQLLRRAARKFGAHEALARARCVVAEAEVALALRDIAESSRTLDAATRTLEACGDRANALHARLIAARRLSLLGHLERAAAALPRVEARETPAAIAAAVALLEAELALRTLRLADARAAIDRAQNAATRARIPALLGEVDDLCALLGRTAARRLDRGGARDLRLDEVDALFASGALVVDGCRHSLCRGGQRLLLARRPLLFALLHMLACTWPDAAARETLIAEVFRTRHPDETHRARLRVEVGRLRALVKPFARIEATAQGFALRPHAQAEVVVLAPPVDGEQGALTALLADGAAWSTSALALAMGLSQRSVQRALLELEAQRGVRAIGRGRAQRWLAPPLTQITTILLLPAVLPGE